MGIGVAQGQVKPQNTAKPVGPLKASRAMWQQWLWGYFFIAPSLLVFIVFSVYPVLKTVTLSFQRIDFIKGSSWVGFRNYERIFQDKVFLEVLRNTLTYFLGIVPLGTVLVLILSVLIFQLPAKLSNLFKGAYYLPSVTSGVVLSLIWLFIFNPAYGILNYILGLVGLEPVLWLASHKTALWSLVFMYHATSWGGSVVLVSAALGGIPQYLYEAAIIDGASRFRQFVNITLPLLRPVLTYVVIMSTISSLQIFNQIYLMTNGGPGWSTTNLVFHVYVTAFQNLEFGLGSAQVLLLLILTIVLAIVQYRYLALDIEY